MTPSPPRAERAALRGGNRPSRPGVATAQGPLAPRALPEPQGILCHRAPCCTVHPTHHSASDPPQRTRPTTGPPYAAGASWVTGRCPGRWILPGRRNPHAHRGGTAPTRLSPPSNRPTQSASKSASITAAGLQRQDLAGRVLRPEDARRPGGSSRETTSPRARGGQPGLEGFSDRSRGNR